MLGAPIRKHRERADWRAGRRLETDEAPVTKHVIVPAASLDESIRAEQRYRWTERGRRARSDRNRIERRGQPLQHDDPMPSTSSAPPKVALALTNGVTTLEILASGCYGSYGELDQPIPSGTFVVAGRYTQLMGVFPGKVVYPATFSGVTADRQMTITIAVPAVQTSFGPFVLTRGVKHSWEACRYP